jgi:PspA-Associated protein
VIVRILGEGQLTLKPEALDELNKLDDELMAAVRDSDEPKFHVAMDALLARVREMGEPLPVEEIKPSDFILPSADSSLDEVRDLLSSDGLIPG